VFLFQDCKKIHRWIIKYTLQKIATIIGDEPTNIVVEKLVACSLKTNFSLKIQIFSVLKTEILVEKTS
jgi:hypothetical protein